MPDPAKAASNIFQAGMDARGKGEPATACPYPDKSGEREQWLEAGMILIRPSRRSLVAS